VFNKQNKQTRKDKMQWALTRQLLPATGEMALSAKFGCPGKLHISPERHFPETPFLPLLYKLLL
jgi:hypothetical protein